MMLSEVNLHSQQTDGLEKHSHLYQRIDDIK